MELNFDFEAPMPKITRNGVGRVGEKWEDHLDPIRKNPGSPARVFTFESSEKEDGTLTTGRSKASSRIISISNRLHKVCPREEWKFAIRNLNESGTHVGLWITFVKEMNDDEYSEYQDRKVERGNRIRNGKNKTSALHAVVDTAPPDETVSSAPSAADRVKAARASRAGK